MAKIFNIAITPIMRSQNVRFFFSKWTHDTKLLISNGRGEKQTILKKVCLSLIQKVSKSILKRKIQFRNICYILLHFETNKRHLTVKIQTKISKIRSDHF